MTGAAVCSHCVFTVIFSGTDNDNDDDDDNDDTRNIERSCGTKTELIQRPMSANH
jgi:hypothetical protein